MNVLIIADDADFTRDVLARWQTERQVPEFAVLGRSVVVQQDRAPQLDLAIVAPLAAGDSLALLGVLDAWNVPLLAVVSDAAMAANVRECYPRVLVLRQHEGWLDDLVLVAGEALRRVEAVARAQQAEGAAADANRYAVLGRYVLEMRHNLNNALTSVLGNAELLLLEPAGISAEVREQIDTIHSMSLRMHEILQRFSSLDTEMQCAEKQSQAETRARAKAFGGAL